MSEIRVAKVEQQGQTKIKNVPIAVTPEGFWCCPSPVVFQRNLKSQNPLNKPKTSSPPHKTTPQKKQQPSPPLTEKKTSPSSSAVVSDEQHNSHSQTLTVSERVPSTVTERVPRSKIESLPRKVAIEFGEPGTSNLKVILIGKQGFCVKLSVHKNVVGEYSRFFASKLSEQELGSSCIEVENCEDVEVYVETMGLMYCKEMRQRLIKQTVSHVLRILKVAQLIGFNSCIQSCLEYLEAAPWVGDEEEEKVISSVLRLQVENIDITPILKRVSSKISNSSPKNTVSDVIELVLSSNEEKSRREMKSVVLKLLKDSGSTNICNESIYNSCRTLLNSLITLFTQAAEPEFTNRPLEKRDPILKQIALQSDNLTWLLDILSDRRSADEFALMWANQHELATLHTSLPIVTRHHVSFITSKLFVGIGRGEVLPSKDTRKMLLETWLEPLINDYSWLQHGCRSFDRKVVEDGIGQTILTLPLEEQQSILLDWLGSFLKGGDKCPNLQRAFEVWWRRTFVRPYAEPRRNLPQSYN